MSDALPIILRLKPQSHELDSRESEREAAGVCRSSRRVSSESSLETQLAIVKKVGLDVSTDSPPSGSRAHDLKIT